VEILESVLFIRVTFPLFDRYSRFQPADLLSTFSKTEFQIFFSLKFAPKGRPKYFIGRISKITPQIFLDVTSKNLRTCENLLQLCILKFNVKGVRNVWSSLNKMGIPEKMHKEKCLRILEKSSP
jgi:hypothetical protein